MQLTPHAMAGLADHRTATAVTSWKEDEPTEDGPTGFLRVGSTVRMEIAADNGMMLDILDYAVEDGVRVDMLPIVVEQLLRGSSWRLAGPVDWDAVQADNQQTTLHIAVAADMGEGPTSR